MSGAEGIRSAPPRGLELRLVPGPAGGPPVAWLVGGTDWGGLRLPSAAPCAVLPRSRTDPAPGGLVVFAAGPVPGALPLVADGGDSRVLVPAGWRLWPPATVQERADLLSGALVVWHPALGPVGFAAEDVVPFQARWAPPALATGWGGALPGVRPAALVGVAIPVTTLELPSLRDDIARESPRDLHPPGAGDGPPSAGTAAAEHLARWFHRGEAGLLRGLSGILGLVPPLASAPTWINALEDLVQARLRSLSPHLQNERERAVERLVRTLDEDPDRGLRFALPLSALTAGRGVATPGSRLAERSLEFDPDRLFRSGPVDGWSLGGDFAARLRTRYLALAEREVALGRHRRAAYIHAALLGDLHAAARVLEEGGHHRDAAAIHRDRLHDPVQAARCLERGGLLAEAAAAFTAAAAHQDAARCLERLGDGPGAAAAWRRAVAQCLDRQDPSAAAVLTRERLRDPQGALDLLAGTWPDHPQADRCLRQRLDLLEALGLRPRILGDLQALAGPPGRCVDACIHVVATTPDPDLRRQAGDEGRRRVAGALAAGDQEVLARLPGLCPGDRLLVEDAARYRRILKAAPPPPWTLRLDPQVRWCTAIAIRGGMVAGGWLGDRLVLERIPWPGRPQRAVGPPIFRPAEACRLALLHGPHEVLLVAGLQRDGAVLAPCPTQRWPRQDGCGELIVEGAFGSGSGPEGVLAVGPGAPDGLWAYAASGALLPLPGRNRQPLRVDAGPTLASLSWVAGLGDHAAIAAGERLLATDGGSTHEVPLPFAVQQLSLHPRAGEATAVLALTVGFCTARVLAGGIALVHRDDDLDHPVLGWTREGVLVAVDAADRRAYAIEAGRISAVGHQAEATPDPVAVVAGPEAGTVVILSGDGSTRKWKVPVPG